MKTKSFSFFWFILLCAFCLESQTAYSQAAPNKDITFYQYRKVAPDKVEEFIKRETTYWGEVAKKAMEKGNLRFWALLEKVGGSDVQNEANFLFINTYADVDNVGPIWNSATTLFPKVPMAQMETGSMSKTTSEYFLSAQAWEQKDKTTFNDHKYIVMVYHNSTNPGQLISLEKKHWAPFIKSIMNSGQTSQIAWGNAFLLAPTGGDVKFNTVSYDLYANLKEALYPTWDEKIVLPQEGLNEIEKLEGPKGRYSEVYRIVKVVVPPVNSTASN